MENHPIPQNVTNFQFKLIGNMTVKQFAYLAAGAILAWIFFSLPLFFLIKFPIAFFGLIFGFGLAFIPIEGRPLDVMISYFIKSIFSPNQYLFQKQGATVLQFIPIVPKKKPQQKKEIHPKDYNKLQSFLGNLPKKPKNKMDEKEMAFFQSLSGMFSKDTKTPVVPPHIISVHEEQKLEKEEITEKPRHYFEESKKQKEILEKKTQIIEKELEQAKTQEAVQPPPQELEKSHQSVTELEKQLNEVLNQRQQLEKELLTLKNTLVDQKRPVFAPSVANINSSLQTQNVKKIPKAMGKSIGMPISPDVPNLIMGIVKDPRGNVLPNILVEVKDKEGNPVRAFKTNGVGQFASATPLLNGVYTIWFEDPAGKNKFDTIELPIAGEMVPIIEVTSEDLREELRKALFTN